MPDFHPLREQIIARIPISELAREYGLSPKGQGEWKVCLCPWHNDKHPSLAFNDRLGIFRCFASGCGRKGSMFDLAMIFEGIPFWEAFCKLAQRAGLSVPSASSLEEKWGEKQKQMEIYHQLIGWFKDNLLTSEPAMTYLAKKRGYSEELIKNLSETIQLGYLPEGRNYKLPKVIANANGNNPAKILRPLAGRIIGPWYDAYGNLTGWWGRAIDGREPKYLFSKGTQKTSLYLLHLARRFMSKPVLCVAEGILDAGIPQTLGFSQIAACGGAAILNKAQLQVISKVGYKVVVLLPDADENGEKAIVKGSGQILQDTSDLGMEILIGQLPPEGKDLDELLIEASQPLEMMEKIIAQAMPMQSWLEQYYQRQQAKASTPLEAALIRAEGKQATKALENTTPKLLGVDASELATLESGWHVPQGWQIDSKGVHRITIAKNGEETIQKVAHAPFIVSARSVNIDSGHEQLEVAFARDKLLRKIWVNRDELLNRRFIVSLAAQGFPVTSENACTLVNYTADFEAANIHQLPRLLTVSSFGWKRYNGQLFFVLGDQAIGTTLKVNFVPEGDGERAFAKALKPKGTLEGWLLIVRKTVAYPKVCFALYGGFTAPILPILDQPSFSPDYCGDSSIGKTTAIMVPASEYGDPVGERGGIVPNWNATPVSIERYASLFKALPIFLDDSHLASDQQVKSVIYMLAGGVGKMRGALKGTQALSVWYTVGFLTGERPVVSVTTHEGARARVIEFYGTPFPGASEETVSEIKTGLSNHFGHAGPIYLEKLVKLVYEHSEELRRQTDLRAKKLKKLAHSGIDHRKASYFAAVWTAGAIAEEIFNFGGDPDVLIPQLFEEVCGEGTDLAQRAIEAVSSWVMGNWKNFDTGKGEPQGEAYGVIKVGEYVAVFPHKLAEFLSKIGYSYEAVVRAFRDREWIQTDGKNLTFPTGYKSTKVRMVKIFWKFIIEK